MKEGVPRVVVNSQTSANDLLQMLNAGTGGFELALRVLPDEALRSTALVSVPSGTISYKDISRVQETALSIRLVNELIIPLTSTWQYELDDELNMNAMPIGFPCKKLVARVAVLKLSANQFQKWHILSTAANRSMVSLSVELVEDSKILAN